VDALMSVFKAESLVPVDELHHERKSMIRDLSKTNVLPERVLKQVFWSFYADVMPVTQTDAMLAKTFPVITTEEHSALTNDLRNVMESLGERYRPSTRKRTA